MIENDTYVIEASKLICDYSSVEGQVKGVHAEQIKIPRVGLTVIYGPSGSGKSTLLSVLTGTRQPTHIDETTSIVLRSSINLKKIDLIRDNLSSRGYFGYVFQEPHLIKNISGRSNAEIAKRFIGNKSKPDKLNYLIEKFDLSGVIEQRADTLSGGQAQRVSVLRALAIDPEVLICDEPTSSLDEKTGFAILNFIRDWAHENKKAVLLITHNLDQAASFGDYFIQVNGGKIDLENGIPVSLSDMNHSEKLQFLRDHRIVGLKKIETELSDNRALFSDEKKQPPYPSLHWIKFLLKIVYESFFLSKQLDREKRFYYTFSKSWYAPLKNFSIIGLLVLGMLVFAALLKTQEIGTRYFENELAKPELRHFTLKQNSIKLTLEKVGFLKNALSSRSGPENRDVLYTRRQNFIQSVWASEDGVCPDSDPKRTKNIKNAPLLVFEHSEPLYQSFLKRLNLGELSTDVVFATRSTFLDADKETEFLCLDIDGHFVSRPVSWIDVEIPGGADRNFVLGMTEQDYSDASMLVESEDYRVKNFSNIAVYFDQNSQKEILCTFEKNTGCGDIISFPENSFLINRDVFKQIEKFTTLSYLSRQAILTLVGSFTIVVAAALSFAMNAEIKNQERSLAILRAFGVRTIQISLYFQLRSLVQISYSLMVSAFILAVMIIYADIFINLDNIADVFNIEIMLSDFLKPIFLALLLTQLTTFGVVWIWSFNNRYVAEKLQGL